MATETITPNVGLQVPGFGQVNWQVPIQYDLALLDLIFGGSVTVPAMNITNLTVTNFTVPNVVAILATSFVSEAPAGTAPTATYVCSHVPTIMLGVYKNGVFQTPGVGKDYTLAAATITFSTPTSTGDAVYVTYFHG